MGTKVNISAFPSCCGAQIIHSFGGYGGHAIPKETGHLYLAILTDDQRKKYGKELEELGYECIKIFRTAHADSYNLHLYASPRRDADGNINNPGKEPFIKEPSSKTPIRDAFGRFVKQRFTEKL